MYEHYFGLREPPFSLTPDTGFFFQYRHHLEALNVLLFALRAGEGFIKVTGEVGTGKTLLCRKLLNSLDPSWVTAYIPNPFLEPDALRRAVAEELEIPLEAAWTQHQLVKQLHHRLIQLARAGKRVVVCIDEAQALSDESLEALRLLSNLETEKAKLLQVVLFGQPELDARLDGPRNRQLRQRIAFSYHLAPLDREGVRSYLAHRLAVAGYNGAPLFPEAAVQRIYKASGGIPRLVNILAHKSLMLAYGQGARVIAPQHVELAVHDTEGVAAVARPSPWWLLSLGLLLMVVAAGALLWRGLLA